MYVMLNSSVHGPLKTLFQWRSSRVMLIKKGLHVDGKQAKGQLLNHRSVIRVNGTNAGAFLQGLMTNDIQHLEEEQNKSMYCMFLNTQGRILYDTLIYRGKNQEDFLIECDSRCATPLLKHLLMFRVRRKVSAVIEEQLKIWTLFEEPPQTLLESSVTVISPDPRTKELGWRVISDSTPSNIHILDEDKYTILRFKLGIGEGMDDLPPGTCFPLESNCDYLHGVSFHKGCYLGQELTARTYHTGVTRKRLMPLVFQNILPSKPHLTIGASVTSEGKTNVGKLRSLVPNSPYGLGLLRIQQALSSSNLEVESLPVSTHRPSWWPLEAPKDRNQLEKT